MRQIRIRYLLKLYLILKNMIDQNIIEIFMLVIYVKLSLCYLLTSVTTRPLRRDIGSLMHGPRPVTIWPLKRAVLNLLHSELCRSNGYNPCLHPESSLFDLDSSFVWLFLS